MLLENCAHFLLVLKLPLPVEEITGNLIATRKGKEKYPG
jgi:hypothetical protein